MNDEFKIPNEKHNYTDGNGTLQPGDLVCSGCGKGWSTSDGTDETPCPGNQLSREYIAEYNAQMEDETFLAYLKSLKLLSNKHLGSLIATATQTLITNPPDDSTPEGKPTFNEQGEFVYHAADALGSFKMLTVKTIGTDYGF